LTGSCGCYFILLFADIVISKYCMRPGKLR